MKKYIHAIAAALIVGISVHQPAKAFPVIDAANLIQNTLSAIQQLNEISNQITQIRNQTTSLVNEAKNLASLPFNVVAQLQASTRQVNQLIGQAQGIAFDVSNSIQTFQSLYPRSWSTALTQNQLAADTMQRWKHSVDALQTAVRIQSQAAQNLSSDEAALSSLVGQSQGAQGALQAAQVTNQLLALHARQMIQDQQLRLAQDRAIALEQARMVAAAERGQVIRQNFMTPNTRYTPTTVTF